MPAPGQPLRVLSSVPATARCCSAWPASFARWPAVALTLLDRQALVDDATLAGYPGAAGRRARASRTCSTGPATTASPSGAASGGTWCRNLFLHHFDGPALARLLGAIAARTTVLRLRAAPRGGACGQPPRRRARRQRRHAPGCGAERARGLSPAELTALWPGTSNWRLQEPARALPPLLSRHAQRSAVMPPMRDAVIVGAGPAGSAAAFLLARAGWSVALIEKEVFPRRKVCGECVRRATSRCSMPSASARFSPPVLGRRRAGGADAR